MLFEMESSLNLIGNNFKCEICEKTFQNNRNIKRHITSAHEGKEPYNREICDATFAQKVKMSKTRTFQP